MPIIQTRQQPLQEGNRPDWCAVTGAGFFHIAAKDARFDCHYHDYHEYWFIAKGKAKVRSEGRDYYVGPGDVLCTKAGDEHDIIEIYEDMEGCWFEEPCPPGGRTGHLHRDAEKAKGHVVPHRPLPPDFPE